MLQLIRKEAKREREMNNEFRCVQESCHVIARKVDEQTIRETATDG